MTDPFGKTLAIASKTLKEVLRQPKVLGFTLGLPVVFMAIFAFAFGQGATNETYGVAVVDHDGDELAQRYVEALAELTHDDGTQLVRVTVYENEATALRAVESRDAAGLVVLAADFTEGLTPTTVEEPGPAPVGPTSARRGPPQGTSLRVVGDPTFPDFGAVSRVVDGFTRAFAEEVTGQSPAVAVQTDDVASRQLTRFDRIAPGLMIFAILNLVPQAAGVLARESESGALERVRQSPTGAMQLLGGITLAQLVIAAVSMALMLAVSHLMGFNNQGSYLVAYGIAMAAALAAIGIGMIVAALVRRQDEASNLAALVAIPVSFLSGAFFSLPPLRIISWNGRDLGAYDLLPTTHAVDAMRQVLTFGRGVEDVAWSLGALALLGPILLLAGVGLYRARRLAPA